MSTGPGVPPASLRLLEGPRFARQAVGPHPPKPPLPREGDQQCGVAWSVAQIRGRPQSVRGGDVLGTKREWVMADPTAGAVQTPTGDRIGRDPVAVRDPLVRATLTKGSDVAALLIASTPRSSVAQLRSKLKLSPTDGDVATARAETHGQRLPGLKDDPRL